jgi:hypothetical protein
MFAAHATHPYKMSPTLSRVMRACLALVWIACSGRDATTDTPVATSTARPPSDAAITKMPESVRDAAVGAELPKQCVQYKAMVEKLADCERLGPQRDLLRGEFDESWRAWNELPADKRGQVIDACTKAMGDLERAVGATCGW